MRIDDLDNAIRRVVYKVYMNIDTELPGNHARCGTTGSRKIQKEHETESEATFEKFRSKTTPRQKSDLR